MFQFNPNSPSFYPSSSMNYNFSEVKNRATSDGYDKNMEHYLRSTNSHNYSSPAAVQCYNLEAQSSVLPNLSATSIRLLNLLRYRGNDGPPAVPTGSRDLQFVEYFTDRSRTSHANSPGAGEQDIQVIIGAPPTSNLSIARAKYRMWGIDVNRFTGTIYVADKLTHLVRAFTREGVQLAEFGSAALRLPTGIAVDSWNNRIIVSSKRNQICVYTLDGQYIFSFGKHGYKDGEFNYPWGVAVSPNGERIVVADSMNHRLQTFDKFGNFLNSFSVFDVDPYKYKIEFDYPRGVTFDERGQNIYTTDFNLNTIFKFNHDLSKKTTVVPRGRLIRPQGITVDDAGNLLVCDSGNSIVRAMKPSGALLANIHGEGEFYSPQDLSILPNGQLAILDCGGKIRIY